LENYEDITYAEIAGLLNPHEPVYCFCNYISYGNMVKCDNLNVSFFCFTISVPKNGSILVALVWKTCRRENGSVAANAPIKQNSKRRKLIKN